MAGQTFSATLSSATDPPVSAALRVESLIIAGWTGRDQAAVEHHIRELEAIGVKRPATAPIFYRVSADRLTTASSIQVLGERSSGEVEFVLLQWEGKFLVGAGSDHTDRDQKFVNRALEADVRQTGGAVILGFR